MKTRTRQVVLTPSGPALKQNAAKHQTACIHRNNPSDGACGGCFATVTRALEALADISLPTEARAVLSETEALLAGKITERKTT